VRERKVVATVGRTEQDRQTDEPKSGKSKKERGGKLTKCQSGRGNWGGK